MDIKFLYEINFKNAFVVLAIVIGVLMPFLSLDYGITEDAPVHHEHGKRILDYFKGIDDTAGLSPIDDTGKFVNVSISPLHQKRGMNGFGGFFDLLSSFLHDYFSSVGVYELRNFLNAFFGFLLFLFCGLLGKEIGDWRAGLLSFVFAVLTPVLFGHAMCNPKDIPFAAFYIFSVFHIIRLVKELPVITLKRSFFLILNISLLINIRLIGLVIIGHVFFAVFVWWFFQNYEKKFKEFDIKNTLILAGKVMAICLLGYLATSVFWPYAQTNPIKAPIELFFKIKEFKGFVSTQLFEGAWHSSFDMPWYYMVKSLFIISMPLSFILGVFLIPLQYFRENKKRMIEISILLFTTLLPLLLVVLGNPNSYDNGRQFLFIVVPLIVISSLSWDRLLDFSGKKNSRRFIYFILIILLYLPLKFMVNNHPLQSMYFGPLIGGVEGAYGNYEIDYWGFGVKPAIKWLEQNIDADPNSPARVRMYYGEQQKASYYLDKIPFLEFVSARQDSPDWDYSIVMLTEAKFDQNLTKNWPPQNLVHEIKVNDTPICYIVKNVYDPIKNTHRIERQLAQNPSVSGFLNLSLLYFNNGDYVRSIQASRQVTILDSKNSVAYNNMCSAYNMLLMYDKAAMACKKSLELSISNLASNNLKVSEQGTIRKEVKGYTIEEYMTMSYNAYLLKDYEYCIIISKELLEKDPKNIIAYNNICASNNNLGKYIKALEACEKALKLKPNFGLAKNNLKVAKEKLNMD